MIKSRRQIVYRMLWMFDVHIVPYRVRSRKFVKSHDLPQKENLKTHKIKTLH